MPHSCSSPAPADSAHPPPLPWPAVVAFHLAPGLALLALFLATAPVLQRLGLPPVWALLVGTLVVLAPLELGIVGYAGRGEGGLATTLNLRRPARADRLPLVLAAASSALLPGAVLWLEPAIRTTLFGWLPSWYRAGLELTAYSARVQIITLALWLVSAVLVGPVVEEMYFRGWLLGRIPGRTTRVTVVNATLFGAYHLWQPQAVLTVAVFALPLAILVRRRGNPVLSMIVHSAINLVLFVGLAAGTALR